MKATIVSVLFALVVVFAAVLACDDDPAAPKGTPDNGYQALTQRTSVLNNLEVSYNRRAINKYNELLDQNFTMFFSNADFGSGKTPETWGRQDEVDANTNLFDPSYVDTDPSNGTQPRCVKISMDVKWEDGVTWAEIEPLSDPGEKWYRATLYYNFQFDIEPDFHFINSAGSKAEFTVRNAGTEDAPHWQLVEMRDLSGDTYAARTASRVTERSTWGQVKAVYQ